MLACKAQHGTYPFFSVSIQLSYVVLKSFLSLFSFQFYVYIVELILHLHIHGTYSGLCTMVYYHVITVFLNLCLLTKDIIFVLLIIYV